MKIKRVVFWGILSGLVFPNLVETTIRAQPTVPCTAFNVQPIPRAQGSATGANGAKYFFVNYTVDYHCSYNAYTSSCGECIKACASTSDNVNGSFTPTGTITYTGSSQNYGCGDVVAGIWSTRVGPFYDGAAKLTISTAAKAGNGTCPGNNDSPYLYGNAFSIVF